MKTLLTTVEIFYLNYGNVVIKIGVMSNNIAPIMCSYSLN
jgi:hypothetical protein